jgi:hypothetical protein
MRSIRLLSRYAQQPQLAGLRQQDVGLANACAGIFHGGDSVGDLKQGRNLVGPNFETDQIERDRVGPECALHRNHRTAGRRGDGIEAGQQGHAKIPLHGRAARQWLLAAIGEESLIVHKQSLQVPREHAVADEAAAHENAGVLLLEIAPAG